MNYHISIWVISHNRIIITIRIHIVTRQSRSGADIPIRIQKPSPLRVIVPALQIVQPRLGWTLLCTPEGSSPSGTVTFRVVT